jgi:AhpD family alkylhydroperoxidase
VSAEDDILTLMEQKVRQYKNNAAELADILPGAANAYQGFTGESFKAGELDARTKQLIALGVALFANNEVCTYYHVQEARSLGASNQQIMETVAVASAASSGHVLSQGAIRVQGALMEGHAGEKGLRSNASAIQDAEFADEIDAPGMSIPGSCEISPSY